MEVFAKLKWRCRRGTKELDYLLEAYLENYYADSSSEQQEQFEKLLTFQDSMLLTLILGNQLPASQGLSELVKKIRTRSII